MAKAEPKKSDPSATDDRAARLADFNATVRKAEKGDKAALVVVQDALKGAGIADVLHGNVARQALHGLVRAYAGENPVIREATFRKLEELRAELSGANPSALEKLLIDRVLATWLHLHHLEMIYASKQSMALSVGLYYQKSISAAQKRYIGAIKGLADVRKLALPALQVNIAKNQVNVATSGPVVPN